MRKVWLSVCARAVFGSACSDPPREGIPARSILELIFHGEARRELAGSPSSAKRSRWGVLADCRSWRPIRGNERFFLCCSHLLQSKWSPERRGSAYSGRSGAQASGRRVWRRRTCTAEIWRGAIGKSWCVAPRRFWARFVLSVMWPWRISPACRRS